MWPYVWPCLPSSTPLESLGVPVEGWQRHSHQGFLAFLNQQGLADIGHSINNTFGTTLDVPKYQFGIYGLIIVVTMLLRPEGLIPSQRRKAEFHEGVADTPLYDVQA